ncbi:hypothetical protein ACVWWK_001576 [Bradyrhizobium sp. LB9.1b]
MTDVRPVSLEHVHETLRRRYGNLEFIQAKGVAGGQRVRFAEQGRLVSCVIKFSSPKTLGRIAFSVMEDGSFSGLSECDRVAVVGPVAPKSHQYQVSYYEQSNLLNAWQANREALRAAGKSEGGQSWLAPWHEEGRGFRGVGDGYQRHALWTEPLLATQPATHQPSALSPPAAHEVPAGLRLNIRQAKEALARNYDVPAEAIDIIIRG